MLWIVADCVLGLCGIHGNRLIRKWCHLCVHCKCWLIHFSFGLPKESNSRLSEPHTTRISLSSYQGQPGKTAGVCVPLVCKIAVVFRQRQLGSWSIASTCQTQKAAEILMMLLSTADASLYYFSKMSYVHTQPMYTLKLLRTGRTNGSIPWQALLCNHDSLFYWTFL